MLEFWRKCSYKDSKSTNSYSFNSRTSSSINEKTLGLKESTIFAELLLELIHKDWLSKLEKINCYLERCNAKCSNRLIKTFLESGFIEAHVLIIGSSYYSQSGLVLFNKRKEWEDVQNTVTKNARFDNCMKMHHLKEFCAFFLKIH